MNCYNCPSCHNYSFDQHHGIYLPTDFGQMSGILIGVRPHLLKPSVNSPRGCGGSALVYRDQGKPNPIQGLIRGA